MVNIRKNNKSPTNFLIIGKRGCCANCLIDEMIYEFKKSNIVDKIHVYTHGFCELDIKSLSELYLDDITIKYKVNHKLDYDYFNNMVKEQSKPDSKPLLLVFDDVISISEPNSKIIKNIIKCAYNYKIYIIMSMQFAIKRFVNFDFCMVFQENFHSNLKRLYEFYFGTIGRFNLFNDIMKKYCKNNQILIIDIFSDNEKIENKIFSYTVKNRN